jgi:hypothetical protein
LKGKNIIALLLMAFVSLAALAAYEAVHDHRKMKDVTSGQRTLGAPQMAVWVGRSAGNTGIATRRQRETVASRQGATFKRRDWSTEATFESSP